VTRAAKVLWAGVALVLASVVLMLLPATHGTVGYTRDGQPHIAIGMRCGPAIIDAFSSDHLTKDLCRHAARRRLETALPIATIGFVVILLGEAGRKRKLTARFEHSDTPHDEQTDADCS
jgi:hypothetical protein